jgi:hypothetical protein
MEDGMGSVCSMYGKEVHSVLVGKAGRKRLVGRPRHRWENSIKMNLKEIGWEDVD